MYLSGITVRLKQVSKEIKFNKEYTYSLVKSLENSDFVFDLPILLAVKISKPLASFPHRYFAEIKH